MTKEAKVGLLLGLLLIIGIAVILRGVHRDGQDQIDDELRQIAQDPAPSADTNVSQGVQRLSGRNTRPPAPASRPMINNSPSAERVAQADNSGNSQSALSVNRAYSNSSVPSIAGASSDDIRYSSPLPSTSTSGDSHGVIRPFPSAIDRAAEQAEAAANRTVGTPNVYAGSNVSAAPVAAAPAQRRIYTVANGDDLSKIALEVYGPVEGRRWVNVAAIYEANKDIMPSMDTLRVGQSLRIPPLTVQTVSQNSPAGGTVGAIAQVTGRSTTAAGSSSQIYVVQEGDSLWKIAQQQLNDGNRHNEILELNRDRISSPSNLRVGMRLRMPDGAAAAVSQRSPSNAGRTYTVREGDSLWRIAERELGSGERYHEIVELNADRLSDENSLPAGTVLIMP